MTFEKTNSDAYLDDELSPTERVKVERLLAADPAARRLVGELRAVSGAVKGLPRQTFGEDLSRTVLRLAERRMLLEDRPETADDESLAVPFSTRAFLQRFINRRTLAWLAVTATVVALLTIQQGLQNAPLGQKPDREVGKAEPAPAGPKQWPVIGPAPSDHRPADEPRPAHPDKNRSGPPDAGNPSVAATNSPKAALPSRGLPTTTAPPAAPSDLAGKTPGPSTSPQAAVPSPSDVAATPKSVGGGSHPQANQAAPPNPGGKPARQTPESGSAQESSPSAGNATPSTPGNFSKSVKGIPVDENNQVVVRCDLTPAAVRAKAFDKVIDANGIVLAKPAGPNGLAAEAGGDKAFVEGAGTSAQLGATVAALRAQPEMFPSVVVNWIQARPGPKPATQPSDASATPSAAETKAKDSGESAVRYRVVFRLRIAGSAEKQPPKSK